MAVSLSTSTDPIECAVLGVQPVRLSQSTCLSHLQELEEAGLLEARGFCLYVGVPVLRAALGEGQSEEISNFIRSPPFADRPVSWDDVW